MGVELTISKVEDVWSFAFFYYMKNTHDTIQARFKVSAYTHNLDLLAWFLLLPNNNLDTSQKISDYLDKGICFGKILAYRHNKTVLDQIAKKFWHKGVKHHTWKKTCIYYILITT